jgi:predicted TIM-barrel fold metal-dependent hydrolase
MIIDIHNHLCHVGEDPKPREDMDRVVAGLQGLGIVKAVIFPLCREHNPSILELTKAYPDYFIPFAFVRLGEDSAEIIPKYIGQGFKGIKFIYPTSSYTDRAFWPVYEEIQKLRVPVLFHTAIQPETKPELLEVVGRNFPEMKIIGSHLGNPWYAEAVSVTNWRPNVVFDFSTNQLIYFERGTNQGRCRPQIKSLYETGDLKSKNFLFGSDIFYNRREYKSYRGDPCDTVSFVKSVIEDHHTAFDDMGMSKEERGDIFYGNAAKLLGI